MSKHTPGPWEIVDVPHGLIVRTESPKKTKYGASRYAAIGGFDRNDSDQFDEALANARLIAAAPELLEALEAMVNANGGVAVMPTQEAKEQNAAIKKARAAIAKAKE